MMALGDLSLLVISVCESTLRVPIGVLNWILTSGRVVALP
jgi:hypothetical protein